MRRRGMDAGKFVRMTCPIGIGGIRSKHPAQIAIAVAAEILQVYDQARRPSQDQKNTAYQRGERA
jgi:xanthine/CO dehydrogenase XdhC/CoxF family maturation factor